MTYKEKHSEIIALKVNDGKKQYEARKQEKINAYGKYKPYQVHKCEK